MWVGIGTVYLLVVVAAAFFQEKLLFSPDPTSFKQAPLLRQFKFDTKELEYQSKKLRYYLRQPKDPKATLLVFHGNGGRAADRIYLVKTLLELPLTLVLAEYPGYAGSSHPPPSQKSLTSNAIALFDHLQEKYPQPLVAMGESLGSGVAFFLASQRPVKGLILLSPFTSIAEVAAHHYFYLPVKLLIRHPFPSAQWASKMDDIPVLAFHGEQDKTIPYSLGEKLWQSVLSSHKKWIPVAEASHNDLIVFLGTQLRDEVRQHFGW